ncbi:SAM-dependent methyltransferase [Tepidiphilus baoligensis]|uniref:SAM-dependent methyltransferase n=1 Tax=Tepidiphilus baoligensis TaxID=2698687 RepID=A0ABX1QRC1_9PROT|nr:SAM-dependent methyltransferase [Tepidiphilus baoligensis]NMH17544.1 SAM-dependent methyltransferase [Tepidiphilus baoligensis]
MQADFLDAHERHWDDAERLYQAGRWANADHLYGLAAECGLKRLMLAFGMPFDTAKDRPSNSVDRVHADGIWARFEAYRCGHYQGAGYALPAVNAFGDWHVSQRYAHQSQFEQARAQRHQSGAASVHGLINKAQRQGLI